MEEPKFFRILGLIVTHQPDSNLERNLSALLAQVDEVVVVDNWSTNVSIIEAITSQPNCRLIKNNSNFGIAHALNQGRDIALMEGFSWLATFDQDSLVTPGMVQGLLALFESHPMKNDIGVLTAYHRDQRTGGNYDDSRHTILDNGNWTLLRTTITSGSMISSAALRATGLFDDSLFIDYVDHDFYMRCRKNQFLIVGGKDQVLIHSLGSTSLHRLFGLRVICSNHSALRRYYMTRNQLEVCLRYAAFEPLWCIQGLIRLTTGNISVLLFEDDFFGKLRAMVMGFWHFVIRRFGRLNG